MTDELKSPIELILENKPEGPRRRQSALAITEIVMPRLAFTLPDGTAVNLHTIRAGKCQADILSFGASIADILVRAGGTTRSVVLGLADLAGYPAHRAHMGAVAGRCANRIGGGRFELDGRPHQLTLNERGRTHLHGGAHGFGNKVWRIESALDDRIALSIVSLDGEDGYPGMVRAQCGYHIEDSGMLRIELTATCDAPTLVNLATHSYFNLGGDTILDHTLTIAAGHYTPVDADLIPTGEIAPVAGTPFDFRAGETIGARRALTPSGFDHNFAISSQPTPEARFAARLVAPAGDLTMELWSTEPGLQFYDGQYLPVPQALRERTGVRFGGCCLEPQRFPDGINHADFPNTVLRPGETYRQVTEYRFVG